jgi:hypothetical protein
MNRIFTPKLNGFIVPNVFAIITIAITKYCGKTEAVVLIFSEFIIIPILMGIICAWFWRNLELPMRKRLLFACYNVFLAILCSYIFLGEGVICLIIVSPLIFSFILVGSFLG